MRCRKCGFISFDWLDSCSKCGNSLVQERELLGHFLPDNGEINWFIQVEPTKLEQVQVAQEPEATSDLFQEVDVSDLMPDHLEAQPVEIEEGELIKAAEDKEFQKALEEIAT